MKNKTVTMRSGQIEFLKVNTEGWEWRDAYQWLLGLNWPQFAAFVGAVYIALNLLFAALYTIGGDCVAGMRTGSFLDAFFSVCRPWPPSGTGRCLRIISTATSSPPSKS